jgi:hypothetical protein
MNEPFDPLEAELADLRPREVSPELRRRVGHRLTGAPRARFRVRPLVLAGGLAAACLAAILLSSGGGRRTESPPIGVDSGTAPRDPPDESWPTLLACQRALARSPEELDALLDRHAPGVPGSKDPPIEIHAFARSQAAFNALLGEN